ncbi:endo-beta-1,4-glucanase [Phyllosticta citrichinensis]|uniref:cellulase n=1 Tax=Phyllosticta citrichinensis TaxID=1130410 RepID=A0ABR1XT42_9PEZI
MRPTFFLAATAASLGLAVPAAKEERAASQFKFFGINESGPEFGETNLPGTLGTDYVWPNLTTVGTFVQQGMNTFRVNFLMERLTENSMNATLNAAYLSDLKNTVNNITAQGAYAMIVPHNYGRFYSNIITDVSGFQTWWQQLATQFASNDKVIFDINNEFHDMEQSLVVQLNQAGINGIRAAGAASQYITVEGNAYTGAWTWVSSGNAATMGNLTDPKGLLIYQMHQYLDSDSSGTSATCVSSTIGAERLQAATQWLKTNSKKGIIGEYAGGNNDVCKTAVKGMLNHMTENSDVWMGAIWWAAGPWWGDSYIFNLEPKDGICFNSYMTELKQFSA